MDGMGIPGLVGKNEHKKKILFTICFELHFLGAYYTAVFDSNL